MHVYIMKRSTTIGFDARYANTGNTTLSSYARFVIEAMADACPRYGYFRMYVTDPDKHSEYELLTRRHNVESMAPDGGFWRKVPWLWRTWPIGRDMERGDVELYHSLTESLPLGLARRNIRSIVTIHSLDFLTLDKLYNPTESALRRIAMASSIARADRVVAVSECVKEGIIRYFGTDRDKIDVIYRNCHPRFSETITEEQKASVKERYQLPDRYLLATGTQSPRKNLGILVEALALIDNDIHLVLVGRKTSHTATLTARAKSLGIADRVHLIHTFTEEDIPAIYSLASLYLQPSLYEGFATTIVEAITVGLPVIAARGSSLEEAGGPDSIYVEPSDGVELASEIERVLGDEQLARCMVMRGKEYITRFRPEVIAYNILNSYRRIGVEIAEES